MNRLFVYGTLRSGLQHPAHAFISRYFTLLCAATVKGKLYDLGEYPGAVPSHENEFITGELYQLTNELQFTEAFTQLDNYEGLLAEPPLFRREQVTVFLSDSIDTAWIYWYNHGLNENVCIESGDITKHTNKRWMYKNSGSNL